MPIKIEHLNYVYNPKSSFAAKALDDICLDVNDGDFLGVIGHTGSGKSTLVSHLNALTRIQSGAIFVDDMDLRPKKLDFKKLRSKVGMVFQYPEYQLFDETVYKDVAFGPRNIGLSDEEIAVRVAEAIRLVGLDFDAIKERSPFELSGGQMRRVALAGVIAMRPDVLVLDEPTAGLDPRGKVEIMELIKGLKKSCPIVVMISHNMDEVAAYCNRIAVLSDGRLHGVYSPRELFRQEELLKSLKIDMPSVTALAAGLNGRGFNVDPSLTDEAELIDAIIAEYGRRHGR
ncbi:MAG: energy-coupling factor transporter ATPase [Christensenellales bacterium]